MTSGKVLVTIGTEKHILEKGCGYFVNSGILHNMREIEGTDGQLHSMVFHPRLVGGSMDSVFYQSYIGPITRNRSLEGVFFNRSASWHDDALKLIDTAWKVCVQEPDGYELDTREALSRLIFLIRSYLPTVQTLSDPKLMRDSERIKAMLSFIHNHFADPMNTFMIAGSVSVSESECLRCFRDTIGTTPIQYLRQYRIQKAAQLLSDTQMPIVEIGYLCGFQDHSYFTKTFRQYLHCTPAQFRRDASSRINPHSHP